MYNMKSNVDEITKESNEILVPVINSIKNRENKRISKLTKILVLSTNNR